MNAFITALVLFAVGNTVFRTFNKNLARNSRGQQLRRYLLAAVQAVLPLALLPGLTPWPVQAAAMLTALPWMCTYNVLYHRTHHASAADYDNHIDIAFAIYLYGWLTALHAVLALASGAAATAATSTVETVLVIVPLAQTAYFAIYGACIDDAGMAPLLNTYGSETREFIRSLGAARVAAIVAAIIVAAAAMTLLNVAGNTPAATEAAAAAPWWAAVGTAVLLVYFSIYVWKPRHGLFVRTGIVALFIDVRAYNRSLLRYRTGMKQRLAQLKATANAAAPMPPHTIIMVIGESACRDYMSAFAPQPWATTPWEAHVRAADAEHFVFFDNAYSCAMQTVPALERVLTERNQYNDKPFADSCSIVDMARMAGYRVLWYSNQSYIGVNDTSVTLVAQTADTAKWVKKEGGVQQYDESLLSFLDEADPSENNFIVLHLKGSHFNYENRYPAAYAAANKLNTRLGDVECYRNSLHYTDSLLQRVHQYAARKLNLAAMLYFSDHGGIPDMRRSPRFLGYKMVRIPMWAYMSDDYQKAHPEAAAALKAHQKSYFTNDLAYELVCGMLGISSNRYDPSASIASPLYRFTRSMLLTYDGRLRISDDDLDKGENP